MAGKSIAPAIEAFGDLLEGAEIVRDILPEHCIPFTCVRSLVQSGKERLKMDFTQCIEGSSGYVSAGSFPHLVVLDGVFSSRVQDFLVDERGMTREAATKKMMEAPVWYGIVDGAHRILALFELSVEQPAAWSGFGFTGIVLTKPANLSELRALARALNRCTSTEFVVQDSFSDRLASLRSEAADLHASSGKKPTNLQVAQRYLRDRKSTTVSTTVQEAQFARSMSDEFFYAVCEISQFEDPDLLRVLFDEKERAMRAQKSRKGIQLEAPKDPRVHLRLFKLHNLRISSLLKSPGRVQLGVIWRAKQLHQESGFKSVGRKAMEDLVETSTRAVREAEKFEAVNGKQWPRVLLQLKSNLLQSSLLDSEVSLNLGNDKELLPSIFKCLKLHCPTTFTTVMRHLANEMIDTDREDMDVRMLDDTVDESGVAKELECASKSGEEDSSDKSLSDSWHHKIAGTDSATAALAKDGVHAYNLRWQEFQNYNSYFQSEVLGKVDMVLCTPPHSVEHPTQTQEYNALTSTEMGEFAKHCNRVLKDSGVVHIFSAWQDLKGWYEALHDSGLATGRVPMIYLKTGVQRFNLDGQPQNIAEFGIVAFKHGKKHYFDKESSYKLIKCSFSRHHNVIDNIPLVLSRLTKSEPGKRGPGKSVRQGEKNFDLLSELIVTYCPDGGLVYDAYAGTLSTAIASMRMQRSCVVIECEEDCFKLAIERLQKITAVRSRTPGRLSRQTVETQEQKPRGDNSRSSSRSSDEDSTVTSRKRKADTALQNTCQAELCLRSDVLLGPMPTRCSGKANGSRCPAVLHDLCDYAKQHQTPEQEREGLFDGFGFCSQKCSRAHSVRNK